MVHGRRVSGGAEGIRKFLVGLAQAEKIYQEREAKAISKRKTGENAPEKVDVPAGSVWQDFLIEMRWTDKKVFGRQEADFVEGNWGLFQLRVRYGDEPGRVSF